MNKKEILNILNSLIKGNASTEKLIQLVAEYLTENNIQKSNKLINLIISDPLLLNRALPTVIEYYTYKYNIFSLIFNNKIIYYYV